MQLHYLQHVSFEDAANIASWAAERGHSVTGTRLHAGEPLPSHDGYDALAIMGGPMNVYQYDLHPWLAEEKDFIQAAIDRGKPVLGVCLGAQLIADVLGGRVTRNRQKEIGWHGVQLEHSAAASPIFARLPATFTAFHWHGDTFSVPPGAIHCASSAACANQAFQYGLGIVGLQFHLEYSRAAIEQMLRHCGDELQPSPYIQDARTILRTTPQVRETSRLLYGFLDAWASTTGDC